MGWSHSRKTMGSIDKRVTSSISTRLQEKLASELSDDGQRGGAQFLYPYWEAGSSHPGNGQRGCVCGAGVRTAGPGCAGGEAGVASSAPAPGMPAGGADDDGNRGGKTDGRARDG